MTTLPSLALDERPGRTGPARTGAPLVASTASVALRTVRRFLRTPQLVVVGTIQGAMFLLIFRYVFGGAITTAPPPPARAATSTSSSPASSPPACCSRAWARRPAWPRTSTRGSSTGCAACRSPAWRCPRDGRWPRPRCSPWSLVVTAAIGFAVGFRLDGSLLDGLAALGLCVLFGFACTWLFLVLGLLAGSAQAAQGMALLVFPLTFVSSAYVPVSSMPGWMRPIAEHQPMTVVVDTVRSLTLGHGAGDHLTAALLWCAGLVVVFAPLAAARFRRG